MRYKESVYSGSYYRKESPSLLHIVFVHKFRHVVVWQLKQEGKREPNTSYCDPRRRYLRDRKSRGRKAGKEGIEVVVYSNNHSNHHESKQPIIKSSIYLGRKFVAYPVKRAIFASRAVFRTSGPLSCRPIIGKKLRPRSS